jgi:hypothetical protein
MMYIISIKLYLIIYTQIEFLREYCVQYFQNLRPAYDFFLFKTKCAAAQQFEFDMPALDATFVIN